MLLDFFYELLNMSLVASVVILAVLLCRILLSKAPKIFSYALWGIVLFRLLCPVSIDFSYSLMPAVVTQDYRLENVMNKKDAGKDNVYVSSETSGAPKEQNALEPQGMAIVTDKQTDDNTLNARVDVVAIVWAVGFGIMLLYSTTSFLKLKNRLIGSVPADSSNKIFYSDYIDTPFVVGLVRPVIYLPSSLHESELEYILLHEKHHIKRGDHIWKTVAFFALSLHWFNPLVWLSFILASKDMEMSCDEAVIGKMGEGICPDYSASLLSLATGKRGIAAMPLAFGEGDTRTRIKNILGWKEPKKWMICLAFLLCLVVIGCFGTNQERTVKDIYEEKRYTIVHQEYSDITLQVPKTVLTDDIYTEEGQTFKENEVVVFETDTSKIYLEKVMISNEGDEHLYFMFNFSYDLPKEGSFLTIMEKMEDGKFSDEIQMANLTLEDDKQSFVNTVTLRGSGPNQKFVLYVSTDACKSAVGMMKMDIICLEITYMSGVLEEVPKEIVETYEKTVLDESHDPYEEWVLDTYYKMSDGTWAADLEMGDEEVERYEYRYRLVFHDYMNNAAAACNYIVLSNSKTITFDQVWKASGLSSSMSDYFQPEDAVIVAFWLGDLEMNHPERDENTIYWIDDSQ